MLKSKNFLQTIRIIVIVALVLPQSLYAQSTPWTIQPPESRNNLVAQSCLEGIRLFEENKVIEAYMYLHLGVMTSDMATFRDENDLGRCALYLGIYQANIPRKIPFGGAFTFYTAEFSEAHNAFDLALDVFKKTNQPILEAKTLYNMANLLYGSSRRSEMFSLVHQAWDLLRDKKLTTVDDLTLFAQVSYGVGSLLQSRGDYKPAIEHFNYVIQIATKINDTALMIRGQLGLALLHRDQMKYDEAITAFQSALSLSRLSKESQLEAIILYYIGDIYYQQAQLDRSLAVMQEILATVDHSKLLGLLISVHRVLGEIYAQTSQPELAIEHFNQALALLDTINAVGSSEGTLLLASVAKFYTLQGDNRKALAYYERGFKELEAERATLAALDARANLLDRFINLYNDAIRIYASYPDQLSQQRAFSLSERSRSRSLLDSLTLPFLPAREENAASAIFTEYPLYAQDQTETIVLTVDEVQQKLAKQRDLTLVSYHTLGEAGTIAFILSKDDFDVIHLPEATSKQLSIEIEGENGTTLHEWLESNPHQNHPRKLRKLYNLLVDPLLPYLKTARVGIIPHQILHYVPFAALTDGITYFGSTKTIFLLPSASAISLFEKNAVKSGGDDVVVFGNSGVGEAGLTPLTEVEEEVTEIGNLFKVRSYIDERATETLLRSLAPTAGILHVAAHATYNNVNPLFSAIHLAPSSDAQPTSDADGLLEANEMSSLDLRQTDMVVLSACETGIGQPTNGDEVIDLTRPLFTAGAASVVSTLWQVDDEATRLLMAAFYKNLQMGSGKAEALQLAQQFLQNWRDKASPTVLPYSSPYYWAAFVLVGDPNLAWDSVLNDQMHQAKVLVRQGKPTQALDLYTSILEHKQYAAAYIARAALYEEQNQPKLASLDYTATINLYPNYAPAYYRRALLRQYKLNQLDDALTDYLHVKSIEPGYNIYLYLHLANLYESLERFEDAIQNYKIFMGIANEDDEAFQQARKGIFRIYAKLNDPVSMLLRQFGLSD